MIAVEIVVPSMNGSFCAARLDSHFVSLHGPAREAFGQECKLAHFAVDSISRVTFRANSSVALAWHGSGRGCASSG